MAETKKKRYYSISEVADMTGLKAHILRYWEGEFPKLRPRKNRAGNRAYTERDIKIVLLIKKLLYDDKYTVEGAKKSLKLKGVDLDSAQLEIPFGKVKKKNELKKIRNELLELIDKVKAL